MRALAFILIIIPLSSKGQYFGLQDSLAEKHSLRKCIEYNKDDSISFFNNRSNGFYWRFDRSGNVIEENFYTSLDGVIIENIRYNFYDETGREYLSVWSDGSDQHRILRAQINQRDSADSKTIRIHLSRSYGHSYSNIDTLNNINPEPVNIDSVISSSTKHIYNLKKTTGDTLFYKVEFYSENKLDSTFTFLKESKNTSKVIERYFYDSQSSLISNEIEYLDLNGDTKELYRTSYGSRGLPTERWYIYGEDITHTGFVYHFYE